MNKPSYLEVCKALVALSFTITINDADPCHPGLHQRIDCAFCGATFIQPFVATSHDFVAFYDALNLFAKVPHDANCLVDKVVAYISSDELKLLR